MISEVTMRRQTRYRTLRRFLAGALLGVSLIGLMAGWLLYSSWRSALEERELLSSQLDVTTQSMHAEAGRMRQVQDALHAERARVELLLASREVDRRNFGLADDHVAAAAAALRMVVAPTPVQTDVRARLADAGSAEQSSDLLALERQLAGDPSRVE